MPTWDDYVSAFCDAPLTRRAVLRLSALLAQVVGGELQAQLGPATHVEVGHRAFGGSIRRHHLDVFIANAQLGLQLGIDVKGLNSGPSVGKNWNNRVGDLHELSTNHHHNFPRAVMGGVLAIPHEGISDNTLANIERAMRKVGGRVGVGDPQNQLERAALLVINKSERRILEAIPAPDGPLRIEAFAARMATIYAQRWVG